MEDKSVFVEYFGDSPYVKILDFLIQGQEFDYSMTEIAKGAGVGWGSFSSVWNKFLEKDMVFATREIGNAKLFRLNKENRAIQKIIKLDMELTKFERDKMLNDGEELVAV